MASDLRPRDPLLWALAALAVARVLWIAPRLLVPDLNLDYPFTDGDSWDWLANSLWWAGADVRFSARPPFLPLLLAACERMAVLRWWPIVPLVAVHATGLALYRSLRPWTGRLAAAAGVLAIAAAFSVQSLELDLMADSLAAALLGGALAAALASTGEGQQARRSQLLLAAALFAGLAAVTQQVGLLFAPALAAAWLASSRRSLRQGLAAVALLALPSLLWAAWKLAHFGTAGDTLVNPWPLVRFEAGAAGTFAWFAASLFGAPGCVALIAGLLVAWRRRDRRGGIAAVALLAPLLFFTFAYAYPAKRLLLYAAWPAAALLALALAQLPRAARATASLLLVATALVPLPEPGHTGSAVALWPLPPLLAVAPERPAENDSPRVEAARAVLRRPALADLVEWNSNAFPSATVARLPPFDALPFESFDHALYLATPAEEAERYVRQGRLGNALRRRLQWLTAREFAPCLQRFEIEPLPPPLGSLRADAVLFSLRTPALAGRWLLVRRPEPAAPAETAAAPDLAPTAPPPTPAEAAAASSIADELRGTERVGVVLPGAPSAQACLLPLLLRTTEIHLFSTAGAAGLRRLADTGLGVDVGGAHVRRVKALGRPAALVTFDGSSN